MLCEIEFIHGLRPLVEQELRHWRPHLPLGQGTAEAIACPWEGDWRPLLQLRLATAVYARLDYAIPRPKALLGHEHLHRLLQTIAQVRAHHPAGAFRTLRLSAAGADSAVFQRLKQALAAETKLAINDEEGDLLVRVRRGGGGWQVLVRLSPRPLITRPWRVANMPGALNGVLAAALNLLTHPQPDDHYLNIACGSGSLLAERGQMGPAAVLAGCDVNPAALTAARANTHGAAQLVLADAAHLPYPSACFQALTADLPWGQLVGTHTSNAQLYPALLAEAARVAQHRARLVLITHEVRLLERVLAEQPAWQVIQRLKLQHGNIQPLIVVAQKGGR